MSVSVTIPKPRGPAVRRYKLYCAAANALWPKHLVLVADEAARSTIVKQILAPNIKPIVQKRDGQVIYRFHLSYLSKLIEAFPDAIKSEGIQELLRGSPSKPTTLEIPALRLPLYPFQEDAVWRVINAPSIFLAADLGLGKTLITLSALQYLRAFPALVCCPNSVKAVWAQEVDKFFGDSISVQVVEGTRWQRLAQIQSGAQLTIINYEALRIHPELADMEWAAVVADESHKISNWRAKQTKAFHKLQAKRKICLSGTPTRNGRYEELWSPLKWMWPNDWPSYETFLRRYCIRRTFHNRRQVVGYKSDVKEVTSFWQNNSIRIRKEDVLKDLPPVVDSVRLVQLTSEQRQIYNQIRDNFILQLRDGSIKSIPTILAQITRLKQACFSPELYGGSNVSCKLDEIKSLVQEINEEGYKAVIFSQWSKVTRIIQRELKHLNPAYVDGTVSTTERTQQVKKFQTDWSCRVYVGTYGVSNTGITLTAGSYCILVDLPWTPADVDQAVGRLARIGQKQPVNVIRLLAEGTIEQRIEKLVDYKALMAEIVTTGKKMQPPSRRIIKAIEDLLS